MAIGKGNTKAQRKRRKINNRGIPKQDKDYRLVDGNYSNQPYAYCCYHKGYMTKNQTTLHKCNKKNCEQLKTLEWAKERNK